jgi:hypothetical protein
MVSDGELYLEHYGVKGMKWGVRKDREKGEPRSYKKAAVIFGSAATTVALALGAAYIQSNLNTNVNVKDLPSSSPNARKLAQSLAKEPVSIIHATRAKNHGFIFLGKGTLDDPIKEYEAAGFTTSSSNTFFRRYGENSEKTAGRFLDPKKREDFAGRAIQHEVVLPKNLSTGINSHSEFVSRAWPLISDTYEVFWNTERPPT